MDRITNELSPPNLPYMSKQHLEDRVKPLQHLATSFSKLSPWVAHQRVGQLGRATSLHWPQKGESTWHGHFLLQILPLRGPHQGEST